MSKPLTPPGWFGKLPSLGDFASRRLPPAFVQPWDEWLQQGLAATREEWGADWLERYLVAPILRFWVDAGVLAEGPWAGVVMPSVDKVGRHFPLTLAQPAAGLAPALAGYAWYDALDATARKVLDVAYTVDDLERDLAALAPLGDAAEDIDKQLADTLLQGGHAVWWRDDGDTPRAFAALPPPREFAALFRGSP